MRCGNFAFTKIVLKHAWKSTIAKVPIGGLGTVCQKQSPLLSTSTFKV